MVRHPRHKLSPENFDQAEPSADEAAQLLEREELDFEDSAEAHAGYKRPKPGAWGRLAGPHPPRVQIIQGAFPATQRKLSTLFGRHVPGRTNKILLLVTCLCLWLISFATLLSAQSPTYDDKGVAVVNLDCTDTFWQRKNFCGIDGIDCRPFSNTTFPFRCPANCASVHILNPRAVGPLDVNYRSLVIGDEIYRGDSFICGSALHAGVIDDRKGGCGRVSLLGSHGGYPSVKKYGIESIPFDSHFPLSFAVSEDPGTACPADPRESLLFVNIVFTGLLSTFGTSPAIFFPIFVMMFALVGFVSDPPSASYRNISVLPDHMSMFAKRLLPAMFCAVIIYKTVVRRTLNGLKSPFEKTLFWLGGFYIGALSNYTFDWIPIQRLTAHDLEQQPGAKLALAIILVTLMTIIAGQIYYFWLEGRLIRYLALYGLFLLGILVCLVIPGVSLRIHHYVLALLLLPGTSIQTRPSLLYQGILLGLFVNGIARWDFDSVIQTTDALRQDGKFESVIPIVLNPNITSAAEGLVALFSWATPPTGVDGISILVNDVERFRGFFNDGANDADSFTWKRPSTMLANEYFRFAFLRAGQTLDYTMASTLFANRTWGIPAGI